MSERGAERELPERDLMDKLDQAIEALLAGRVFNAGGDSELEELAKIAGALRYLPAEDFKTILKTDLERRTSMSTSAIVMTATQVRAGFRAVTPFMIHENAPELVEFITRTFGAEELKRNTGPDAYGFYSEVRIGDSVVMIGGGSAARRGNLPSALHVYVDDCDATYLRALESGARTLMGEMGKPGDRPYGERSAYVEDAFGNYWYIATRLPGVKAPEGVGSVLPHIHPESARKEIEFLKRAFGAEEMQVIEHGGRVVHAAVRIGDGVVEMGEPEDRTGIPTNGLFVWVDDVEAVYKQALAAGGTAVRPPDQVPHGVRSAIVRSPGGYLWWPARMVG